MIDISVRFKMIPVMLGIALCSPSMATTDFGQIHFLGSVLYSGCYVQAISHELPLKDASHQNKVNRFDLNFSYCRLTDNGKVLAEITLVNPQQTDFQVYLKNTNTYLQVDKGLHHNLKNRGFIEINPTGQSRLQIQTFLTRPFFDSKTKKTFDIELIFR